MLIWILNTRFVDLNPDPTIIYRSWIHADADPHLSPNSGAVEAQNKEPRRTLTIEA
jgi:hypothetical protein